MNTLKLGDLRESSMVLGPGKRFVLWVQGCQKHCPECISPEWAQEDGGTLWNTDILTEYILSIAGLEGITISGGEPFLQAEALVRLISNLKNQSKLSVIIYTGYYYHEILTKNEKYWLELLENTDVLIDGPYISSLNDNKSLFGSSNQNVIVINDQYAHYKKAILNGEREIELKMMEDGLLITGIPENNFLNTLKQFSRRS